MSKSILKPCPFCGKKPILIQRKNKMWDIGCIENMSCFGWICSDKNCKSCSDGYVDKKMAIKHWNSRI